MAYFKYCFIRFSLLYTIYLNHLIVYLLNRKDKSLHRYFESTELAIGFPNGVIFLHTYELAFAGYLFTTCIPTGFYLDSSCIPLEYVWFLLRRNLLWSSCFKSNFCLQEDSSRRYCSVIVCHTFSRIKSKGWLKTPHFLCMTSGFNGDIR